jgi:SAM-dependent methyltransferase
LEAAVSIDPNWWASYFGEDWLLINSSFPPDRAVEEIDALVEYLGLSSDTRVLDLACGTGRHSIELARRRIPVLGLDYSEPSLERARQAAGAEGLEIQFVRGDMRALQFDAEFDVVINLFSAFGYFDDPADDERTIAGVARALRPGGRFALETINPYSLMSRFQPQGWSELPDGTVMVEERRLDLRRGRSEATWTLVHPDGSRSTLEHSIRLYTPVELEAMFRRKGMFLDALLDAREGTDLTQDAFRMLVIAAKDGDSPVE